MSKVECQAILKVLTKKDHVVFTKRCNEGIQLALALAASKGRTHQLQQEEGGWLTYAQFAEALGLTITKMVTDDGVIFPKELNAYGMDELLIINSLAGYIVNQPMDEILAQCIQRDIFLINDVSGSIGSSVATQGDIIVGSFGKAKPVDLGTGGFIATSDPALIKDLAEFEEPELDFVSLLEKLKILQSRRDFLQSICKKIKQDLSDKPVVHKDAQEALNVVVRFENEEQKTALVEYCDTHRYEYTVCPREIRILDDAISIEVKRLTS